MGVKINEHVDPVLSWIYTYHPTITAPQAKHSERILTQIEATQSSVKLIKVDIDCMNMG
jgi:hypothetical protein